MAEEAAWDWGGWRTCTLPKVAHSAQSWAPQCNFVVLAKILIILVLCCLGDQTEARGISIIAGKQILVSVVWVCPCTLMALEGCENTWPCPCTLLLELYPLWMGGMVWACTYIPVVPTLECWHDVTEMAFLQVFKCHCITTTCLTTVEGSNGQVNSNWTSGITSDCWILTHYYCNVTWMYQVCAQTLLEEGLVPRLHAPQMLGCIKLLHTDVCVGTNTRITWI